MTTEEILIKNDTKILDEYSKKLLKIYHWQWELDGYVWVFFDGRMFTTNHGNVCVFTKEDLKEYIKEMEESLSKYKETLGEIE